MNNIKFRNRIFIRINKCKKLINYIIRIFQYLVLTIITLIIYYCVNEKYNDYILGLLSSISFLFVYYMIWILPINLIKKSISLRKKPIEYHKAVMDVKTVNVKILFGLLLFVSAIFTYYQIEDKERFEQFKNGIVFLQDTSSITSRIGGILSLENVMKEKEYRERIKKFFCSYIKEKRERTKINDSVLVENDIQLIIEVLGKREISQKEEKMYLSDLNLNGANFKKLNFVNVDFSGTNLENADFTEADLENAILENANLYRVNFKNATLSLVDFKNAKGISVELLENAKIYDNVKNLDSNISKFLKVK